MCYVRRTLLVNCYTAWLEPVPDKPTKAHCRCCDVKLMARVSVLRQHARCSSHLEKERRMSGATTSQQPATGSWCIYALLRLLQVKDRVPSKELRERLGINDIILILQQNTLRWYGHVLRKEDTDWVNKCVEYEVEGSRPRGRPKQDVEGSCAKWLPST